jgi:hypothetical protein
MKKRLRLKKVTLRNLDDAVMDQVAGGATGVTECGNTCPGRCQSPQITQVQQCTWDGCTNGCQASNGCGQSGTCNTHCQCPSDPGLTCANTCANTCASCWQWTCPGAGCA